MENADELAATADGWVLTRDKLLDLAVRKVTELTAERDALAAENARLREAVKDAADAVSALRGAMVPLSEGRVGWVDPEVRSGMRRLLHDTAAVGRAARSLVEAPR